MFAVAVLASALAAQGGGDALADRIDASLAHARATLLSSSEITDGAGTTGERALAALAALRSGAPAAAPAMSKAVARIFAEAENAAGDAYAGAYHAGLFLMLLEELGTRTQELGGGRLARTLAERLVEIQRPDGGWGDVSRTEFACLGFRAAERLGERVPESVWRRVERYLVSRQGADGGWGYREGEPETGSMTAGACAALVAAGMDAAERPVLRGLAWLREHFGVDANPSPRGPAAAVGSGGARHRFYYLASLAALARECGTWPERDWAAAGARALLAEQLPNGGWGKDSQGRPTEFATIFLVEARRALSATVAAAGVTVGVCSPDGRGNPEGMGPPLSRALGRWTEMRTEVSFRRVAPRLDGLRVGELAFVMALAGRTPFRAGDVAELARYIEAGGTVLVEGNESLPQENVLALARRIRGGEKSGEPAARRAVLPGPAPLGAAEAPEILLLGEGLIVAPAGVLRLVDTEDAPGARSSAERAAVNAFALAVSR